MGLIIGIATLALGLVVLVLELPFWGGYAVREGASKVRDLRAARARMVDGVLHCPNGHPIAAEGETYTCTRCGYTYTGSIWLCENPECAAVTPYVDCPTCSYSVRNPWRWGRP